MGPLKNYIPALFYGCSHPEISRSSGRGPPGCGPLRNYIPGRLQAVAGAAPDVSTALILAGVLLPLASGFAADLQVRELKHPDGSLKERYSYTLDDKGHEVRQGLDEEFYPGGSRKGARNWKDGLIEGSVVYYHPNGRKSYETNYVNGKKNGFATVWYMNGQKQWETAFKAGKTHGRWREWYLDGRKKFEATYAEGALDGLAIWWHDNGRTWQERSYQSGVPVKGSVKEWDKSGKQTYPPPADALPVGSDIQQAAPPQVTPPSTAIKIENPR